MISIPLTTISDVQSYIVGSALYGKQPEGIDNQGAYARISYKVRWADRWNFMLLCSGVPFSVSAGGSSVVYKVPLQYPDRPGLFCSSISSSPMNPAPKSPSPYNPYGLAQIDLEFRAPVYPVSGDNPFLTVENVVGGNFVSVPTSSYKFIDGFVTPTDKDIGVFVPERTIQVMRHLVPTPDVDTWDTVVGQVNSVPFFGKPAGTVLAVGFQSTETFTPLQTPINDVMYSFAYKSVGWNFFLSPLPGAGFVEMSSDGTSGGDRPYMNTDLNVLFNS